MKREDFIKNVAQRIEKGTQTGVKTVLEAIEDEVFYQINLEEEVPFKFGKIGGKRVPARMGKNPKTGASIKIAEKRGYPYFKASNKAKGKI